MAIVVFRPARRLLAGVSIQHEKGAGQSRDGRSLRGGEEPEFDCSVGGGCWGFGAEARPLVPGLLMSFFGTELGGAPGGGAERLQYPATYRTELCGVRVLVGGREARLVAVMPGQINLLLRHCHSERATAGAKGAAKRWSNRSELDSSALEDRRKTMATRCKIEERIATAAAETSGIPPPSVESGLAQIAEALHGCMAPGSLPPDEAIVRQIAEAVPHAAAEDVAD